jgi:hypothetical protein
MSAAAVVMSLDNMLKLHYFFNEVVGISFVTTSLQGGCQYAVFEMTRTSKIDFSKKEGI